MQISSTVTMRNIFTRKLLDQFARQVPELEAALRSVKMELIPTEIPPFEMLVKSIVYQQLAYKAARTIYDRFLDLLSELTPKAVLAKTQEELRSVGLSRQKASYVQNVAEAFGERGSLEQFNDILSHVYLETDQIIDLFTAIKGVGEWTVQMYLIFSLGKLSVLAANDLGVRKGVMKLYGLEKMPNPKQVKEIAEKWHPLETVGTCLAWRILEQE